MRTWVMALLLLAVTVSAEVTTQNVDFYGTVCLERAVNMTRVEKMINVTYPTPFNSSITTLGPNFQT